MVSKRYLLCRLLFYSERTQETPLKFISNLAALFLLVYPVYKIPEKKFLRPRPLSPFSLVSSSLSILSTRSTIEKMVVNRLPLQVREGSLVFGFRRVVNIAGLKKKPSVCYKVNVAFIGQRGIYKAVFLPILGFISLQRILHKIASLRAKSRSCNAATNSSSVARLY